MARVTVEDSSWAVRQTWGRLLEGVHPNGIPYVEGTVATPHGLVTVDSYAGKKPFTRMRLIVRGREHCRAWNGRAFTPRGLATLATKFAREMDHK